MSETGGIDFGSARNNLDLSDGLQALVWELGQAREAGRLDAAAEARAVSSVRQAIRELNMPAPSRETVLDHLESAREGLANGPAESVAAALDGAAARVRELF